MARFLVIEDNLHIRNLYERLFHQDVVISVGDAESALETLQASTFDMVILDMYIRQNPQHKDTKVIVVSADDTMRSPAREIGIQKWMTKPIEIVDLLKAVQLSLKDAPKAYQAAY
jgi:CheY-like chemotaxis protein